MVGGRRYYSAAVLKSTQQTISRGSFVALNPGQRARCRVGGESQNVPKETHKVVWIAAIRQLFEVSIVLSYQLLCQHLFFCTSKE